MMYESAPPSTGEDHVTETLLADKMFTATFCGGPVGPKKSGNSERNTLTID